MFLKTIIPLFHYSNFPIGVNPQLAHLFYQIFHLFNVGSDVTFSLQAGGRHIAGLAENRPFRPGTIVHPVDPGHTGIGVSVPAIQEIFIVDGQSRTVCFLGRRRPFKIFLPQYMRI